VNNKKKKRFLYITVIPIFVILLFLLVNYILTPQPINAMMVNLSGMTKYENHIYMEQSIPEKTREEILNDYEKSKARILGFFDEISANPTIIFVQSQKAINRYAQNQTGQTYYTYWGNYIVIGPNGFNKDVIAHELMHAELRERLENHNQVPVWFDEGLAALVDERYSNVNDYKTDYAKLEDLKNRDIFNDSNRSGENYRTAKSEVNIWYANNGKTRLNNLINGLNNGLLFNKLYNESK
jgi:hypothetical protein